MRVLVLSCTAACFLLPSNAIAQASESEAQGDIVVTGERVARGLRDTAASVDVTTGDELQNLAGIDSVSEILSLSPNVLTTGAQNNGPTIRGQNTTGILSAVDAFFGGSRPRTTILVDGRPLSYNEFIYNDTGSWDISQVEVFLGPQTTSQGVNSIAGIINVRTNDPTDEFEGAVRGVVGNYDLFQLSGMVNVPVAEGQMALRISADHNEQRTYLDLPDTPIGVDPEQSRYTNIRAKLLVEPHALPDFRTLITYNYADSLRTQSELVVPPAQGSDERIYPPFEATSFGSEVHSVIGDLSYRLGERLTLSNRFIYSDVTIQRYAPAGLGPALIGRDEMSNEMLLTYGRAGDRISGVAGIYYQETSSDEFTDFAGFGLGDGFFTDKTRAFGLFGELTVSPVSRLFLTAGLRYQEDSQDRDGGFDTLGPVIYDEAFNALLPKFGIAYDVSDNLRIGVEARRGYNPGGLSFSFLTAEIDTFEDERLWNYELYWRANLLGGALQLNGNIFYTDFENTQRPINRVIPDLGIVTDLAQAEDARSYGAEVQLHYRAHPTLAFDLGVGLLNTELRRVSGQPDLEGKKFQRAPGATATLGVRWEPIDNLTVSAQGRYVDDYFSDDANRPQFMIDSYFLANAQLSYEFRDFRLFGYVTNAFDEYILLQDFGFDTATATDPRRYGVGLEFRF